MPEIRTPRQRAYYPASQNEPDRLLCWIPPDVFEPMIEAEQLDPAVKEDYPDGLEVEVSSLAFDEFGLDLAVSPATLQRAYKQLRKQGMLPDSGMVDGPGLERLAWKQENSVLESFSVRASDSPLPEPEMTEGVDPLTAMRGLTGTEGDV